MKQEKEGAHQLDHCDEKILRSMMCKRGNVKQIRYQLAHHLPGVVLVIIGEGELLVMVEKLLSHISLHLGAHHMSLVAHIIFA